MMWISGLLLIFLSFAVAEDGLNAWLRYAPLPRNVANQYSVPASIVSLNNTEDSPVYTAGAELQKGFKGIFGKQINVSHKKGSGSSIVVGTISEYKKAYGSLNVPELEEDGYWLSTKGSTIIVLGQNQRGALYGTFKYLSMIARGDFSEVAYGTSPDAPIRWVNQWDNLDGRGSPHGSVERGYGGPSIFFREGKVLSEDTTRAAQYARILASIGVNAVVVNNVNANASLLAPQHIEGLGKIADAFRPYGVKMALSLNFASPQTFGRLDTFDPLNEKVIAFWDDITKQIYNSIPDLAGYLVKANSEGQPGPLTYNRTLAQGANLFAERVKPHGGIVMFRAFVYNQLNYTDWKADRANAAVEFFKELDGKFDENVVVQVKYGPIDFQVREPVSPLFSHLRNTNAAIELQVSQEYLGQQCHLVFLNELWKTILDFDLRVDGKPSLTRDIVSGKRFGRPLGGYAAVVNVGSNPNWLGSHLAMSNLYAYGRMAWDPTEDSQTILRDWTRLTFGLDRSVIDTITRLSLDSWPAYESYSGNLGIQTLTDILYAHYGPNPASQDNNGWGQWTRADRKTIGMDRTVANGTGNAGQYPPEISSQFENIASTPDDILLWFHHVPYTHRLKSGKTIIQHFYDAHYKGAEAAHTFPQRWESLQGKIDKERYEHMLFRLNYQAGHAIVWRDAINHFYYNLSGIPDAAKRVSRKQQWRVEAESMILDGYKVQAVTPFHTASNYTAVVTSSNSTAGTVSTKLNYESGTYDIAVGYYDIIGGKAKWQVYLNNRELGQWIGDNEDKLGHWPSEFLDGHSATRTTFRGVKIRQGDTLRIVGTPDGNEAAPIDYVAVLPPGVVD